MAGVPLITGAVLLLITVILNVGKDALSVPSLVLITIPVVVPTSLGDGVPDNIPVVALNVVQLGALTIVNVKLSLSTSLAIGAKKYAPLSNTDVAGVPLMVGALLLFWTVKLKPGNDVLTVPSLTLITIPVVIPTSLPVGVPDKTPVLVLNVAQLGALTIVNVKLSLSTSFATGVNRYAVLSNTDVAGVPLMVGALLLFLTVMLKAGNETLALPSLTLITIPVVIPTSLVDGVPDNVPVEELKVLQFGALVMEKVRLSLSTSFAIGVNKYATLSNTEVAGVPLIVGAVLLLFTVILKAANEALAVPSLTLITIPVVVPTSLIDGVPDNEPEAELKVLQLGAFVIEKVRLSLSTSFAIGVNKYAASSNTEVAGVPLIVGGVFAAF